MLAPGATLVLGADLHPDADAEAVLAAERGARRSCARPRARRAAPGVELLARGAFQRRNFAVACTAARGLARRARPGRRARGRRVDARARAASRSSPTDAGGELVLDGAHNAGGIAALAESLPALLAGRPLVAVVSVLDDKDAAPMLERLLAAVRGHRLHGQRQPARAVAGALASLARRAAGGVAGARRGRPARARWRSRASSPGPTASCWRPARSTSSPTSCAPPRAGRGSTL